MPSSSLKPPQTETDTVRVECHDARGLVRSPLLACLIALALSGAACERPGGAPGGADAAKAAYLEYREALKAADLEVLRGRVVGEKLHELDAPDAAQKLQLIQALMPDEVSIVEASVEGGHATLDLEASMDGQAMTGVVKLAKQHGRWKLADESWSMTITMGPDDEAGDEAPLRPALDFMRPRRALTLTGHEDVTGVVFTPDGETLVSASYGDMTLRTWSARDGSEISRVEAESRPMSLVALPDGTGVLTSHVGGQVVLWPLEEDRLGVPRSLLGEAGTRAKIAVSPDGRWIASTAWHGPTVLWDGSSGRRVRSYDAEEEQRGVAFGPSGERFATGGYGSTLSLWHVKDGGGHTVRIPDVGPKSDTGAVAFSPDGRWLATGHMDSSITVWEVDGLEHKHGFFVPDASTYVVRFSPDGAHLLSGHQGGKIYVWESATAEPVAVLPTHKGAVTALAFSPDGSMLASGGEDGNIVLWH